MHGGRGSIHDHAQVGPKFVERGWIQLALLIDGLHGEPEEPVLRRAEAEVLLIRRSGRGKLPESALVGGYVQTDQRDVDVLLVVFEGDLERAMLKEDDAGASFLRARVDAKQSAGHQAQ